MARSVELTYEEHLDALQFVAGDQDTEFWCAVAGVHPERLLEVTESPEPLRQKAGKRLTIELARTLRSESREGVTMRQLMERYGMSKERIYQVLVGRTWKEQEGVG